MAGRTAVEVLTHDHREVEDMFSTYAALPAGDGEQRQDIVERVIIELVRHSIAEEEYLYPSVRKSVPGGETLPEREIEERQEAEQTMTALEECSPDDADFDRHMQTLMRQTRQHVAEEEGELFPQLQQQLSEPELLELGDKIEKAKKTAPTWPHVRSSCKSS